ncbi:TonB-dependent receptor plug domain-containing protein, partial [Klebsiella pneumoniae]|uniref:TonB-dependent receptor plug domain-containing protein n=1 Tax=Klebsiella pneumoniae TaxID=573 RepID=UPI00272FD0FA
VVGSRAPTEISQIPGTVWVIDRDDIEQQADTGADLKTVLGRLVPGLDLAPQGRTNFGQNLRGRSVQVLIDGVSMNGSRGLSRQFDAID